MDVSIVFGLLAALSWGSADFMGKLSTQRIGALRTVLLLQSSGTVLLLFLTFYDLARFLRFPTETYIAIGIGAILALASYCLFKAIEMGQLSMVSPVASSYPALTTILAVSVLHETLSQIHLVGIVAILVGIFLVSLQRKEIKLKPRKRLAAGVGYALLAFVSYGSGYFLLKFVVNNLGPLLPTLMLRMMGALVLAVPVLISTKRLPSRGGLGGGLLAGLVGVVGSVGLIMYNTGLLFGSVALVSTVSGLFSAVTVVLALAILKERMSLHQGLGLLAIFVGIVGCSV